MSDDSEYLVIERTDTGYYFLWNITQTKILTSGDNLDKICEYFDKEEE